MAPSNIQKTCKGRTLLKWSADGSLAEHDHRALMERLCSADPALAQPKLVPYSSPRLKGGALPTRTDSAECPCEGSLKMAAN